MKISLLIPLFAISLASVCGTSLSKFRTDIRQESPNKSFSKHGIINELFNNKAKDLTRIDSEELILDPFEFRNVALVLNENHFRFKLKIPHGSLTGLTDVDVKKLDFNMDDAYLDMEMTFPLLKLTAGYYELEGDIWSVIPLAGRGIMDIEVHTLTIRGKVFLKPLNGTKNIHIDKIENAHYSIGKFKSWTEYDKIFDEILNAMIEDLLANFLNRVSGYILTNYMDEIIEYINYILETNTF